MRHTLGTLFSALRQQSRVERAHFGNLWFHFIARAAYNAMFIIFIDQLFKRIGMLGNYSQNDFMFLYFVSQFGFYICYHAILPAYTKMVEDVRTGHFDFLLLKPVPRRAFAFATGMKPIDFLLTSVPLLVVLTFFIQWGDLSLTPLSVFLGFLVWFSGFIICNTMVFSLILPAFRTGDSTDMLSAFYSLTASSQIPFSKMPSAMKLASLLVLPQVIVAGASAEVFLGKSDALFICLPVYAAALFSILIYHLLWRFALKNYTSASS